MRTGRRAAQCATSALRDWHPKRHGRMAACGKAPPRPHAACTPQSPAAGCRDSVHILWTAICSQVHMRPARFRLHAPALQAGGVRQAARGARRARGRGRPRPPAPSARPGAAHASPSAATQSRVGACPPARRSRLRGGATRRQRDAGPVSERRVWHAPTGQRVRSLEPEQERQQDSAASPPLPAALVSPFNRARSRHARITRGMRWPVLLPGMRGQQPRPVPQRGSGAQSAMSAGPGQGCQRAVGAGPGP
jgi:hypothetical protein